MFGRIHPAWVAFGGSALLLAGLIALLYWDPFADAEREGPEPLLVYCAEALRVPMEAIARDYEREVGQQVLLQCGASQAIVTQLQLVQRGDVFLPADESFMEQAQQKDLVATPVLLARMTAVAVIRPGYAAPVRSWAELVRPGHKLGLGN